MVEDPLASLKAIDHAILTEIVRQDQHSPTFEIMEWSIRRLSGKGLVNPDGLWLVSGLGHTDGASRPWSVVVKFIKRPRQESPLDSRFYWKRELLVAQSGLLKLQHGSVRAPRFYLAAEYSDWAWLWMEHVEDGRSGTWTLDDYIFSAHQLGRWNGMSLKMPLPTEPWLTKHFYREWIGRVNLENDWQSPLHEKYISSDTRLRVNRIWEERELFYHVLENLPQCFSHFDCNRRNILIQRSVDGQVG